MTKTTIIVAGNPITIDTEANVSTDWRVWLSAVAFVAVGIGGGMWLMSWLIG